MTSTTTNTISKVAAIVAASGLVALSFVAAIPAHAQTATTTTTTTMSASQVASLQAQIASLQAQLSSAQGTPAASSMTFTRSLKVGSKGADVTALQTWLIAKGYAIPAGATGYFGAQTKAAVAAYQSANGITPAVGYFGPKTMAAVNAAGGTTTTTTGTTTTTTTTTGGTTTTTPVALSGGAGSIDNFKIVGALTTSFNAADTEQVYGVEFKANPASDLMVNRMDFDVWQTSVAGSPRPWNFFQTATLMRAGNPTPIATVDATNPLNWSQDGTTNGTQIYRIRFAPLTDVVKAGTTADYYLSFTTQGAISSTNAGGTYTLQLVSQGVRAADALGIQQYSSTGVTAATFTVTNTTQGSAVVSLGSDNPQTSTVQGNASAVTTGVTLLTFTIQAKASNLTLYTLPVVLNTSTTSPSTMVRTLRLYSAGKLLDTESVLSTIGSSQTITFNNINLAIPLGTTASFQVQADINKLDGVNFVEGMTASTSVTSTTFDIENGSSNTVTITGAATGNTITFRSLGLGTDAVPTTSAVAQTVSNNASTQTGTFNFTFNATAFGQDIYISSTSNGYTPASVFKSDGTTAAATTTLTSTADRSALGNYVIHAGQTKSITVSFVKAAGNAFYYAKLQTLLFGTTDGNPLASTITLPTAYQTNQVYLSN
jgi:peptidoglycan hydrolase-like protein with peptidoglycan-binding domain